MDFHRHRGCSVLLGHGQVFQNVEKDSLFLERDKVSGLLGPFLGLCCLISR